MTILRNLYDAGKAGYAHVTEEITRAMQREGLSPEKQVYRAISGNEALLSRILRTGTDRTTKDWEKSAEILFRELYKKRGFTKERAKFHTSPSGIWAMDYNDLSEGTYMDCAFEEEEGRDLGIVSAYDLSQLTRHPNDIDDPYYEFKGNPKDALIRVFKFTFE